MRIVATLLGPAQGTGAPWAFWLVPRHKAGLVGKGGTLIGSTNQGHIPVAACRRLRVRRIQPERYVQLGGTLLEKE
jgi:hypothetical protein